MNQPPATTPDLRTVGALSACCENTAVARCLNEWERVYKAEKAKRKDDYDATEEAEKAYRDAMPPLSGYENIRDFIACVAHAMIVGAIADNQASKLLYAAQVALSAVRCQPTPARSVV
jgi:Na+/glutamate symporter